MLVGIVAAVVLAHVVMGIHIAPFVPIVGAAVLVAAAVAVVGDSLVGRLVAPVVVLAVIPLVFLLAALGVYWTDVFYGYAYGYGSASPLDALLVAVWVALFGVAWAFARNRDLLACVVAMVAGIVVGSVVLTVVGQMITEYSHFNPTTLVVLLIPIGIAWLAALLCPRSSMNFIEKAAPVRPAVQPVIVGHTADGRPVYAAPNTAMVSAGPNGLAIGAFVCSLTALSIVAVILGHLSISQSRQEGQQPSGLAIAGLILGYLTLATQIVVIGWFSVVMNGAM